VREGKKEREEDERIGRGERWNGDRRATTIRETTKRGADVH
jgi:hypothetical protein